MKRPLAIVCLLFSILTLSGQQNEPVKIGLLIQDKNSLAARQGAEMAVKEANQKGGLNGRPFQLVVKSMEGPWGAGSKQAVDLIFQDQVWALLGSHDGRNGHTVEQAATKSIVVFVSAWSSDPTLSQAFVPWFYNAVPTDIQQGEVIYNDIHSGKQFSEVAIISDQSYDSKQSLKGYMRINDLKAKTTPRMFLYENYAGNADMLVTDIKKFNPGAIIIFCTPENSYKVLSVIKQNKMSQLVYCSLIAANEDILTPQQLSVFNGVRIASSHWQVPASIQFSKSYTQSFGEKPGLVAYFSYDAANMLINAIKNSNTSDRESIQESMSSIVFSGITGKFSFDRYGNRSCAYHITALHNGIPSEVVF